MKQTATLLSVFIICIVFILGCKKIDTTLKRTNLNNNNASLQFYDAPKGTTDLAKRVI